MIALNVTLTREDYITFYTYVSWDSPENRNKRIRFYIRQLIPLAVFLFAFYYTGIFRRDSTFILIFGVAMVATAVLSLMSARSTLKRQAEKVCSNPDNESIFRERQYVFSDTGILVKDPMMQSTLQWAGIIRKVESQNYYILFLNGIQALIIPKRAFASNEQQDQFVRLLSQHLSMEAEVGHLVKS
jgi:hypothetical protein